VNSSLHSTAAEVHGLISRVLAEKQRACLGRTALDSNDSLHYF